MVTELTPSPMEALRNTAATDAGALPTVYWHDAAGNLVQESKVKDIYKLRHLVVSDLCRMAVATATTVGAFCIVLFGGRP